jgi:Exostosin family
MIILNSPKVIYIHIHKAGGESVEYSLAPIRRSNDLFLDAEHPNVSPGFERFSGLDKHSTALEVSRVLGADAWIGYFSWTTVRNPYARMVSFYGYIAAISEPDLVQIGFPLDAPWKEQRSWVESVDYPMKDQFAFAAVRVYLGTRGSPTPFSDFLRHPLIITDEPAYLSQFARISDATRSVPLIRHAVKLEKFTGLWPELCREMGLPPLPLKTKNETPSRWKRTVADLFASAADVELINRIHADDFRWLDYEMMGRDPVPLIYSGLDARDGAKFKIAATPDKEHAPKRRLIWPTVAAPIPTRGNQAFDEGKLFQFRAAPISECALYSDFISDKSKRSIPPSDWVKGCSDGSDRDPEVYVGEAFGGASPAELSALIGAIESTGKFVILIWTDDWAFPSNSNPNSLVFDVSAPTPRSCGYGWNARKYGPDRLSDWKPFAERRILASFVGSRKTHRCREILFDGAITNRPDVMVEDVDWWGTAKLSDSQTVRAGLEAHFAETLLDSKFAFCPRGNGPSSKRRWEAAYCGAIPILIDDFTNPFGVAMPLLEFARQDTRSVSQNAIDLLALTVKAILGGQQLQDQLRLCLTNEFDVPLLAASHTTVKQIVRIANKAWVPGKGFAPNVS